MTALLAPPRSRIHSQRFGWPDSGRPCAAAVLLYSVSYVVSGAPATAALLPGESKLCVLWMCFSKWVFYTGVCVPAEAVVPLVQDGLNVSHRCGLHTSTTHGGSGRCSRKSAYQTEISM